MSGICFHQNLARRTPKPRRASDQLGFSQVNAKEQSSRCHILLYLAFTDMEACRSRSSDVQAMAGTIFIVYVDRWYSVPSRYVLIYGVTFSWGLQEIRWNVLGKLMILSPLTNSVEIFAFVPRVEVHVSLWPWRIPPDLAEYACVDRAHELLSNYIEAVS